MPPLFAPWSRPFSLSAGTYPPTAPGAAAGEMKKGAEKLCPSIVVLLYPERVISKAMAPLVGHIRTPNKAPIDSLHAHIDLRVPSQHSGLEANSGEDLEVVSVSPFATGPIPDPSIGSVVEEVSGCVFEVMDRPDVLKVGKFSLREV